MTSEIDQVSKDMIARASSSEKEEGELSDGSLN